MLMGKGQSIGVASPAPRGQHPATRISTVGVDGLWSGGQLRQDARRIGIEGPARQGSHASRERLVPRGMERELHSGTLSQQESSTTPILPFFLKGMPWE